MAGGTIKGITVELNGDTTGLTTALHDVNGELRDTQADLKKVDRLLKLDPGNTELVAQKQRLLADAIEKTKSKLETLREAAKQAQGQLERGEITQQQYDALQREVAKTEQELKNLEKQAITTNETMAAIGKAAEAVAKGADKVASSTKKMSTAAAGAVAGIAGAAYSAAKGADDLNTLAKQTGFTADQLQKMQYAADLVDVSVSDMTGAAAKLKKNMSSGAEATVSAFEQIGVATTNADGSMREIDDVFFDVLQGLAGIENETERDQVAMTLFGKSADSLAGIIDDGGAALREYGKQAEDLGLILDQDTLDALNDVNDEIDTLKANAKFTLAKEGAKAMDALLPVFEKVVSALGSVLEYLGSLDSDTIGVILTVLSLVAAISPVAGIIAKIASAVSAVTTVIQVLTPVFAALNGVIAANPIILIVAGVVALIAIFAVLWVKCEAFRNFWIAVWDAIVAAAVAAVEWVKGAWETIGEWFSEKVEKIGEAFSKVKEFGKKIVDDIKAGIAEKWESLTKWFSGIWDKLFGNRSVDVDVNGSSNIDGTQALGLSYVPFSGYLAQLHKGEAVLTAAEAREWRDGRSGGNMDSSAIIAAINALADNMSVNVSLEGDARQLFRQVRAENNRVYNATGYNTLGRSY